MAASEQRIAVIGAGYVGLVTAVGLAALGHQVDRVEVRPDRLAQLRGGIAPFFEAGLQPALAAALSAGRLGIHGEIPGMPADLVMVCVGTPIDDDGESDLSQLVVALGSLRPQLDAGVPLVVRSTLPVGSSVRLGEWARAPTDRIFSNPEFLRQGTAYHDFLHPARVVVGRFPDANPAALERLMGAYAGLEAPLLVVDVAEAELIKNGANAFLALKLSFTNELAGLCEEYGADVDIVMDGIGRDPRIGRSYLRAGFGFGGSCLPKELQTLALAGTRRGLAMHVTTAASTSNRASQHRFAGRIAAALGGLDGRRIALLGLAFKAGTDDVRASPALRLAELLIEGGADVRAYDPQAGPNAARDLPALRQAATAEEALEAADAAVIATDWEAFRELDWATLRATMRQPLVIDGRRLLDGATMRRLGFRYEATGSPAAGPRAGAGAGTGTGTGTEVR